MATHVEARLLQAFKAFVVTPWGRDAVHFDHHFRICCTAPLTSNLSSQQSAVMQPATELPTSIAGKVYDGIISVVSYFAVDYTSNWNWHLEDLGSLIRL
ncbi:hypothetical protein GQ600_9510 [Phytophthora cactorum]|nr:hypothetical protein GQ600_9510 [Phytophthora cactorum]